MEWKNGFRSGSGYNTKEDAEAAMQAEKDSVSSAYTTNGFSGSQLFFSKDSNWCYEFFFQYAV
jgi:hypothetical protein